VFVIVIAAQAALGWQLMRQHGRLIERVRALEEGAPGRQRATPPPPGLPIGTPAPAFALVDLDGTPRSLSELLAPGRTLALAFSEPDCPACAAMPPALARLQAERDGELDVVLISRGSREENEAKLGAGRLATVLLQSEREVALQFNVASVPSALTIGPDGRVTSRLAVGLAAIEDLLDGGPRAGAPALAVMHR
jgi:methylamine dehydrogenase accessory protein MauD